MKAGESRTRFYPPANLLRHFLPESPREAGAEPLAVLIVGAGFSGLAMAIRCRQAGSGPLARYLRLKTMQRESYMHFFYEVRFDTIQQPP